MRVALAALLLSVGVSILVMLRAGQGAAGSDPIVRVGSATPAPGSTFMVPVEVLQVPPNNKLGVATLQILYEADFLSIVDCVKHPSSQADLVLCNMAETGLIQMTAADATGLSGNVSLANLTFQVTGSPPISTMLNVVVVQLANTEGQDMANTDEDGVIVVTASGPPTPTPTPFTPTPVSTSTATATATPTASPGGSTTPAPTGSSTPTPSGGTISPAPTPTKTAGVTPTPGPVVLRHGDVDCSGSVGVLDALHDLRFSGQLGVNYSSACPSVGAGLALPEGLLIWGDINCDGTVNPLDAMAILGMTVSLPFQQWQPCPHAGEILEL